MSLVDLTNNGIYTFTNQGNITIALHLDDNKHDVFGRPVNSGSKNQLWKVIKLSNDSLNFNLQSNYSNGFLKYETGKPLFCTQDAMNYNQDTWVLQSDSDRGGFRIIRSSLTDISAYLSSCDTPNNCPILMGSNGNHGYDLWNSHHVG